MILNYNDLPFALVMSILLYSYQTVRLKQKNWITWMHPCIRRQHYACVQTVPPHHVPLYRSLSFIFCESHNITLCL